MRILEELIARFNEVKEELSKSSPEDTVDQDNKDESPEELEKAGGFNFKDKMMASHALNDAHKVARQQALLNKPALNTPHPQTMPSQEEHAARASSYDDFMPQGYFGKNERMVLSKNGQWDLVNQVAKGETCPKCHKDPCEC